MVVNKGKRIRKQRDFSPLHFKIFTEFASCLPEIHTSIRNTPQQYWKRSQKRHFPYMSNYSTVFRPPDRLSRQMLLNGSGRSQKRHYCNTDKKTHLNNYF